MMYLVTRYVTTPCNHDCIMAVKLRGWRVPVCVLHSTSTRSRPSLMTREGGREWRTRESLCEVKHTHTHTHILMVHTRPAAAGTAADYETKADCLHLIMASQIFSIPLLLPNPSLPSRPFPDSYPQQRRRVGQRVTPRTTPKVSPWS